MENKKRNILIMIAVGVLCVLLFGITRFFNKGEIEVFGQAPYTVAVNGKEVLCAEEKCVFSVVAGKYDLVAKKDGYKDIELGISLRGRSKEVVNLDFSFIPIVELVGDRASYLIDAEAVNNGSILSGESVKIRPVPGDYDFVEISDGGEFAFFKSIGTVNYWLEMKAGSLKKLNLGEVLSAKFDGATLFYIKKMQKTEDSNAVMGVFGFTPKNIKEYAFFTEEIESPELFVASGAIAGLVYSKGTGEMIYLDFVELKRKSIGNFQNVNEVVFSPNGEKLAVGIGAFEGLRFEILNQDGLQLIKDSKIVALKNAFEWINDSEVVYATGSNVESAFLPSSVDLKSGVYDTLMKYNLDNNTYTELYKFDESVDSIQKESDGSFLVGTRSKVYRVKI